jgi:hypothetical protein
MHRLSSDDAAWMLRHGQTVRVTLIGRSMEPTIQVGWSVLIEPLKLDARLQLGEVILLQAGQCAGGALVLHRVAGVIATTHGQRVYHAGERSWWPGRVHRASILGKARAIEWPSRAPVVPFAAMSPLRRARLAWLQALCTARSWLRDLVVAAPSVRR